MDFLLRATLPNLGVMHMNIELHTNLDERLSVIIEHQLYHVWLELIHNVIKHAKASRLIIHFMKYDNHVRRAMADN